MFRASLIAAALCATAACSKGGAEPSVAADVAQAGDVREVTGTVTAHRGSASPHALAVGDVVSGDDVIDTGADGSIVIELRHNGVRWSLGANQSKQVSQSVAWQAPRATVATAPSDDRDTAAGRHAERSAADTAESAVAGAGSGSASAPGSGAPPVTVTTPTDHERTHRTTPPPKQVADKERKVTTPPDLQPDNTFSDKATGHADLNSQLDDSSGGGGGGGTGIATIGGGGTGSASGSGSAAEVPTGHVTISGDDIAAAIRGKYTAALTRCYKSALAQDPAAEGKATVTFSVAADGTVSNVSVDAGSISAVHDCVANVIRNAKLGAQKSASDESMAITFVHD